jgi:hypothetical protein
MAAFDKLPRPMRDLGNEYGGEIVTAMVADGHNDPDKLREELEAWRSRRQEELLQRDYGFTPAMFGLAPPIAPHAPSAFSTPALAPSNELSLNELFPEL